MLLLAGNLVMQPVSAASFSDVSSKYEEAIDFLVSKGIHGMEDRLFGTHESITRADAAVFVAKALGLKIEEAPPAKFTDVPKRAVQAVNALKEKEITKGKTETTFGAHDRITRGELAMWLTKAFALKGVSETLHFTDVAPRYQIAVQAMVHFQITNGVSRTQFGTDQLAKRGDFALFVYRASKVKASEEPLKIEKVEAINGRQIEVSFSQPIDQNSATLIEKSGNRIVAYDLSQQATSAGFVSEMISFSKDRKSATVILKARTDKEQMLMEGKQYTVALVSHYGDHLGFAEVEASSKTMVLLEGLHLPQIKIDESQNYVLLKFDRKMGEEARNPENYGLYDLGVPVKNALGEGEWADTTTKTVVKFNIQPNVLAAGKTYRMLISNAVASASGDTLPEGERLGTLKTPTVEEAKPQVEMVRVTALNQVVVTFDRTLATFSMPNLYLFSIQEKDGQSIAIQEVSVKGEHLILRTKDDQAFDEHLTYTVSLPTGAAWNDKFTNAVNDALYQLDAIVAENKAPTALQARFVRQEQDKKKADLHLTFNHAVTLEHIEAGDLQIEGFGERYLITEAAVIDVDRNDQTGRTLVVKDVAKQFFKNLEGETIPFTPRKNENYQVVVKKGRAKSIAPVPIEVKQSNQADLKVVVNGIDVLPPQIERVTLQSAEEIVIQFDKMINTSQLNPSDIRVAGFVKAVGARYELAILTGKSSLVFSVDGNKLTIKPASESVKFQTGQLSERMTIVTIAPDTIKDVDGLENEDMTYAVNVDESYVYDQARPIIIGATVTDTTTGQVNIMYSEEVYGKTTNREQLAKQFNVSGAERVTNGTDTRVSATPEEASYLVDVSFTGETFKQKAYSSATLTYTMNLNYAIQDVRQNMQATGFITGIYLPLSMD